MKIAYLKSLVGNLKISSSNGKICSIDFCDEFVKTSPKDGNLKLCLKEVEMYFAGKLTKFSTKFELQGSQFEQKVYKVLLQIPYGKIVAYKQIAEIIGSPNAFRAQKCKCKKQNPYHHTLPQSSWGKFTWWI